MIELRKLNAFVAVAEELHITRAAIRIGMQQPPLTRLIKALELDLGTALFRRHARGVSLTEAGAVLLEEARVILARSHALPDLVRGVARGERGRLAIGFTSSAALHPAVPAALRRFRERYPGVSLTLEEAGTPELVEGLAREELDAAFLRSPAGKPKGLSLDFVLDEPMVVAMPTNHPLARPRNQKLGLEMLRMEHFVLYRRRAGPGLYDAIVSACQRAGFSPTIVQEAPRLPSTLSLVEAGIGISLIPASMQRLGGESICCRSLGKAYGLSAPLHLARGQRNRSVALMRFRDVVLGRD